MSIEDQIHLIGRTVGWIILSGYIWSVMNYFVKAANRRWISDLPQDSHFRKGFSGFMRAVVKSHRYVPLFMITVMLIHLMMELIHQGFFITGIIVFCLLSTQIILGAYGAYKKNGVKGPWLYAHRINAALLGAAIAAHVASVIILKP